MSLWLDMLLVLLLIGLNGFFAMAELAVLSVRKSQLRQQAEAGSRRAGLVLAFRRDSNRFLASVQAGITLVSMLAGVFSGATLAQALAAQLGRQGLPDTVAQPLALLLIVLPIGFLSLVFGELVPKQIGLRLPLTTAKRVALPMHWISQLSAPLLKVLTWTSEAMLRLLQLPPAAAPVSEEEILLLLQEGHLAGHFDIEAQQVIERVLDMSHAAVAEYMTPRRRLLSLDLGAKPEQLRSRVLGSMHRIYPVYEGDPDRIIGLVSWQALWPRLQAGQGLDPTVLLPDPLWLPDGLSAFRALARFRDPGCRQALVFDRYGMVQGLVTPEDLLKALLAPDDRDPMIGPEAGGSWLIAGEMPLDRFGEHFGCEDRLYALPPHLHTLAGLVLYLAGNIPAAGDALVWQGLSLEVAQTDGPRLVAVRVRPQADAA